MTLNRVGRDHLRRIVFKFANLGCCNNLELGREHWCGLLGNKIIFLFQGCQIGLGGKGFLDYYYGMAWFNKNLETPTNLQQVKALVLDILSLVALDNLQILDNKLYEMIPLP